ncbi:MAG: tRNA lysidine(34) synthetase TilS [Candidatus Bipolaricaulia bacterium]
MVLLPDIKDFLDRHAIENSSILAAVSGGVDSMALLHGLNELKSEFNLELAVAHLDHGLRGKASTEDAEFVRKKSIELGIDPIIEKRSVGRVAQEESQSLEEIARSVRYSFLSETARSEGLKFVALGHNRNDQAETILMHVIRGAGLRGLGGMNEKRDRYIRPLLQTSRQEITQYVEENELDYRIDETNKDKSFTRNRIRHDLIPKLERDYNPKIIDNLVRLGDIAREAQDFLESRANEVVKKLRIAEAEDRNYECFDRKGFLDLPPPLQRATIRKFLEEVRGNLEDISFSHVEAVVRKLEDEPASTKLDLPGITFRLDRNRACFDGEQIEPTAPSFSYKVRPGEETNIREAETKIILEIKPLKEEGKPVNFSSDRLIEAVDWCKVEQPIVVRNRADGDRFVPLGMNGTKKLKDFFIDLKVPIRERDRIPIVCDRKGIIWVVGYRIDDRYKVDETTEEILTMKARKI